MTKSQLIYSVSCFNLGGLGVLFGGDKPLKAPPWRRDWLKCNTDCKKHTANRAL